ncbi:MAG TPA: class I SAM-dependent methyltransferase [Candidatus Acidoferrum sp.]|nr:class I SAM-dependent methyltransferase [Candidatus Acidoferrum sp.]
METPSDYELLDAGDGRRLERFGAVIVDRPAASAIAPRREPSAWPTAGARFDRSERGEVRHAGWTTTDGRPTAPWTVAEGSVSFELRLAPSGQVGLFPEQAPNRRWIAERVVAQADRRSADDAPDVLNLFGYTGGSTIAAVAVGAHATHVDAARPAVAWARRNAELNGFAERPVRWIADDATAFVRREVKRGRRYSGVVLDPPSYGHGAGGRDWRLERDLPPLLAECGRLVGGAPDAFIALTAHTPGVGGDLLADWLGAAVPRGDIAVDELGLRAVSGTRLLLGWSIRWTPASA